MRVEWGGVEYPAVLDPVWTSTASLAQSRGNMPSCVMESGRALVAGGRVCAGGTCTGIKSTEVFDPATETWALAGDLTSTRDRYSLVVVPGKGPLAISGDDGEINSTDVLLFSEATGQWSTVAPLQNPRADYSAVLLADKKTVVVLGGVNVSGDIPQPQVEIYDAQADSWSSGGTLVQARYWAGAGLMPDGKILLTGGTTCSNCGPMPLAEIYDPVTKTSTAAPNMGTARLGHGSVVTSVQGAPAVLVFGGGTNKAEYFEPTSKTWKAIGNMSENRAFFASLLRPDGSVLVAGGGNFPFFQAIKGVERLDPQTLTWSKAAPMGIARALSGFAQLADNRVLVAGGISGSILNSGNTTATAELFQPSAVAEPCLSAGDCLSGFCVDGVCCDTACNGPCQACTALKKGGGADGSCGPVAADTDPDEECATQDKSTCGTSGACDGQGACARYPVNTPCGPATCTDGVSTGLLCDAAHQCQQQVVSCAPFLCESTTACSASCQVDLECVAGAHCDGKVCKGDLAQGAACSRNSECASGFCADGVCCNSACEGTCQACKGSLKEGGGADGLCGPALASTDPHNDCDPEPEASCDKNGFCDGKGACAVYAAGTPCQAPTCASDVQGVRVDVFACDGSGTCKAGDALPCEAFGCEQGACKTSCGADSDCAPRSYCDEGACFFQKDLGALCQEARECLSGSCVDGVCCNSACEGQCEACDVPKALGLCVPVSGAPHGAREACAAGPEGKPCEQRSCDGVERSSCEGLAGLTVSCRAPSCADGVATPEGLCDGKGGCTEPEPIRCEPFVCQGDACASTCASDADCSEKFRCDLAKGDCVPRTGAYCEDESTLINPDGSKTSCAPYACEGSACETRCSSVKDCALPNICDEATRTCIPAVANASDNAGCQASPGPAGAPWLWLLALVPALRRRRPDARR